jgi:anti-sigma regulatory factor (Ser/Thr protein kinase)
MPASYGVGGDWYDFFQLPRGRFGMVIGDVVGHGLKAAALMGQLRTALHAYALEDHPPGQTLQLVDRYIRSMPQSAMATAAYAVLDPETGGLQLASAGHLPPLVITGGEGRVLDVPPSPPLGAFPYATWSDFETSLDGGETLLFYTDGLVERPGTPLLESVQRLVAVTAEATGAEEACQLAVEQMIPFGRLRDDIAIAAMHYGIVPEVLSMRLPTNPPVLAEVRRMLRRWLLARDVSEADIREIVLAVSEACANAIEHAYSPAPAEFEVTATASEDELRFVVRDEGAWRSPRGVNRGRGLNVVRAAMDDVEVRPSDTGTEVVMTRRVRP